MASRQIAVRITIDNRDAINNARAQEIAMRGLNEQTDRHTHLQDGLTNSFIKGNLAARAISVSYLSIRDSLKFAGSEAVQFEHNLTKIAAITDTGGASLRSLEKTVRDLSLATNQSQNELAKTALEMSKMGLTGPEVEKALGGVAKLARAMDEDLVRTGETVVAVLNAYGFSVNDANKVTNELAFTVKASALSIESFGTAFSYVGGTAKAAGVSFTELQGSMDVLSNAGIKASTIGTQLRRIIADLSDPSSKAGQAIGGQTIETLGLVGALGALREQNIDIAGLTAIFGRTASSVASILIRYSDVVGDLAKKTGDVGDITDEMSTKMNTTLASSLAGITVAWADLGISVSKSTGFVKEFTDQVRLALDTVAERTDQKSLVNKFQAANPDQFQSILRRDDPNSVRSLFGFNTDNVVAESPEFQTWKLVQSRVEADLKRKENAVSELKAMFQNIQLPKNFDPNTQLDLIQIAPENTYMFNYMKKLFGTDEKGFQEAMQRAKIEFALKAEHVTGEEFDTSSLKKKKKVKATPDFDPMDVFDRLQDLQPNGDTHAEAFMKRQNKRDNRDDEHVQRLKDSAQKFILEQDKGPDGETSNKSKLALFDLEQKEKLAVFKKYQIDTTEFEKAQARERLEYSSRLETQKFQMYASLAASYASTASTVTAALAQNYKSLGGLAKTAAMAEIAINTAIAVSKVWGQTGLYGVFAQAAPIAMGVAQAAIVSQQKFASGTDQVVRQPTMMMVGEAGAERVRVTPRNKMREDSDGGGGATFIIQGDVYDYDKFQRKVKMAQDSNRKAFV